MTKWIGYQHGVNFGGWLSQCKYTKEHFDTFITEEDFKDVSQWEIDHLRIPFDYNVIQNQDGSFKEDGFAYLEKSVQYCEKYKLNLLLDLHKTKGYSFDAGEREEGFFEKEELQENFYAVWEEIARRFGNIGERVAFELLNEVVEQEVCQKWNEVAIECMERIRKIAPKVKIVFGGYWNNNAAAVRDLAMPYDENVVYNFHCYDPLLFTHQGAYWVDGMPKGYRCSFSHTVEEIRKKTEELIPYGLMIFQSMDKTDVPLGKAFFMDAMKEAAQVAKDRNVMLYCGEYGVIELAEHKDTIAWYQAIEQAFDEYGIGRAAWSYKEMDFDLKGFSDTELKAMGFKK